MKKLFISATLLSGIFSYAGGFRVSLQGVKQLAMAHTSAHTEDASIAFFNPAGISFIPNKLSIVAGSFAVLSEVAYQNPDTHESYSTNNPVGTPIYAAIAYKITDNFSIGMNLTTPFGSTIEWPKNWSGNEIVDKMQLKSFFFQPAISVKMADWMSVGVSYIYARGSVDGDRTLNKFGGTMNIKDTKAKGHGFGLGFYFRPNENLDISIAYRSPVDIKANNGTLTFSTSPTLFSSVGLNANGQDKFTATLPLVEEYTIGATYKITPKWLVSADMNYTGWSKYDALTLKFANAQVGNQTEFSNFIAGRLGFYHDQSPYGDENFIPETPSFNNNVLTGGIGLKFNNKITLDLSGAYAFMQSRNSFNDHIGFYGQAKSKAAYFGLGISYNPF